MPEPRYVHPRGKGAHQAPKDQVKYGPGAGLDDETRSRVHEHLYGASDATAPVAAVPGLAKPVPPGSVVTDRLSQYDAKHSTYVAEAERTGRGLTREEHEAKGSRDGKATNASINHVIASGVGQNTLNTSIGAFARAADAFESARGVQGPAATPDGPAPAARGAMSAVGRQAAAVGRMQMYNRAIAFEGLTPEDRAASRGRDGAPGGVAEGAAGTGPRAALPQDAGRNRLLQQTLGVMQGPQDQRLGSYKGLLKDTFDSPANLRVGHGLLNGAVSTGLDVELDHESRPTERSRRLEEAHLAAAPDHDEKIWTTVKDTGDRLSSSETMPPQPG